MIFDRQLTSALPAAIVLALYAAAAGPGAAGAAETPAKDAADAGAALGVDLYRLLCAQDGNILFSPYPQLGACRPPPRRSRGKDQTGEEGESLRDAVGGKEDVAVLRAK